MDKEKENAGINDLQKKNEQRLKNLIVRVGDQGPANNKAELLKLSSEIIKEFQKEQKDQVQETKDLIIKNFVDSICLLSQKGSLYATAISLIDLKINNFAELVFDKVLENLQKALDDGELIVPKHCLIFLGELMNIGLVNSFSFMSLLYDLANEAEKTIKQSFDYYLYIIICIFPYLIVGLSEKSGLEFQSLVDNITDIFKKRDKTYLNCIRHFNNKEYEDKITILWNAILDSISKNEIEFKTILKPYTEFEEEFKNIKQIKKNKKIYFNNKNLKKCIYQAPEKITFFEDEKENICLIDKLLLSEDLSDVIELFQQNKKILIQRMSTFHCPDNFIHILLETIFSEMLNLPDSKYKTIVYASILVTLLNELDENNKTKLKNFIFATVDNIFQRIEFLDFEIVKRLKIFLAFYLSNKNLEWDFKKWEFIIDEESQENQEKLYFLKNLLTELSFLSKSEFVQTKLSAFSKLLPKETQYKLKFDDKSLHYTDHLIILDKFNAKISMKDMETFLQTGSEISVSGDTLIEVLMQTFLFKTHQSYTHLKTIFERYEDLLIGMLSSKENSQFIVLNSIQEFWVDSNWHIFLYINKFIDFKILKPNYIVIWIFKNIDKSNDKIHEDELYWTSLEIVVDKILNKIEYSNSEITKNIDLKEKNQNIIEKNLGIVQDELKSIFILIFKKFGLALLEYSQNNKEKFDSSLQRLLIFCRKYRRSFDSYFEKLEEEFSLLSNIPEIKSFITLIKIIH